jgi:hypothetical protein
MPSKLNSEFNYRTQVQGETVWEKIKILKGFLEGRKRAAALQEVDRLRLLSKKEKLKWLQENNGPLYEIYELQSEIVELESVEETKKEAYELNRQEIEILERLLAEAYEIAEPTRIPGYTDEQMFEINAPNEFTVWCAKEIHAEILANGRPSPARLRNAMSCPETWNALKKIGLIPENAAIIQGSNDPLKIELSSPILSIENKIKNEEKSSIENFIKNKEDIKISYKYR